jgi:hypothetical protein
MKSVYITQDNDNDYSDAERFGQVVFLAGREYSIFNDVKRNKSIIEYMARELQEYCPKTDYIVLTGNPITQAIHFSACLSIAEAHGVDELNVLRWDKRNGHYVEFPVHVNMIVEAIDKLKKGEKAWKS